MARERWPIVYRALRDAAREVSRKYARHHPRAVAAVLLRASLHDRPVAETGTPQPDRLR